MTLYSSLLETYTLEEILEINDLTPEECLEYLVEGKLIHIPEVIPLEFE